MEETKIPAPFTYPVAVGVPFDGSDASPAFVADKIYIRGDDHLYCIGK